MKYLKYVFGLVGSASLIIACSNLEYSSEFNVEMPVAKFMIVGVVCALIFIGTSIKEERMYNGENEE